MKHSTFFKLRCWLLCLIVHLVPSYCALCAGLPNNAIIVPQGKAAPIKKYKWGVLWSKWVENIIHRSDDGTVYTENPSYGNFLFIKLYVENTTNEVGNCEPPLVVIDEKRTAFDSGSNHTGDYLQVGNNLMKMDSAPTAARQILPGIAKGCYMAFDLPNDRKYFLVRGFHAAETTTSDLSGVPDPDVRFFFELVPQKFSGKMSEASLLSDIDSGSSQKPKEKEPVAVEKALGTKCDFNRGKFFFSSKVKKTEAEALGRYLTAGGIFNTTWGNGTIQLDKKNNTFLFRQAVTGKENETIVQMGYCELAAEISLDVFNGADVEIHRCDESMKTLRVLHLDPNLTKSLENLRKHAKDALSLGTRLEFSGSEVFFTSEIKKAEAVALGNLLVESGLSKLGFHTVQLDKKNDTFLCRTNVDVEKVKGAGKDAVEFMQSLFGKSAALFSIYLFKGATVEIQLCDASMKTSLVICMDSRYKKTLADLGTLLELKGGWLFFSSGISKNEAMALGNYLEKIRFFNEAGCPLIQLDKRNGKILILREAIKGKEKNKEYLNDMSKFAADLSKNVFKGAAVEMRLCDTWDYMKTVAIVR